MGLVHTCIKYWNMQSYAKEINDEEQIFPNNMILEIQVNGLAKLGLGNLISFPNLD